MDVLKVSSKSKPNSVAGALASAFKSKGAVEIQAIGAGALNQAIKSIAMRLVILKLKEKKELLLN